MENHYKPWMTTELRFIRENLHAMTDEQLGEQLGRSMAAVWSMRKKMRILRERVGTFQPGHTPANKGKKKHIINH